MGRATCQDVSTHSVLAWEHKLVIAQTTRTRGYGQMRNCMSVKLRRRVCQIFRANTRNPRMCGSTSGTLTCKWLARAVRVASFNSRCSKSNLDLWELPLGLNWLRSDTVTEKAPLEEGNRALLSHLPIFAFFATTDAGPDQVAARDMTANEMSPVLCLLFFSVELSRVPSASSLRAIFVKWTELRGPASSMLHASN